MKIVDLSIAIENKLPSDPDGMIPQITYLNHKDCAEEMAGFFGNAKVTDLPGGNGWANEMIKLSSHSGTHLDAPWHYYPTMNGGEPSWTIDQIPLEWCFGAGVVADFRDKPDGYNIQPEDFDAYFAKINHPLAEGDIVLLMTGADRYWGQRRYLVSGCGVSRAATLWLTGRGVRVMGTDAWSWDIPLPICAEKFSKTGDASIIWEGHRAGSEKAYCHIEKLTNLDQLPVTGFRVVCLPVKIKSASAGWARVVALID